MSRVLGERLSTGVISNRFGPAEEPTAVRDQGGQPQAAAEGAHVTVSVTQDFLCKA